MNSSSLKRLVFLALLVMSISLVPSVIVLSAPDDGSGNRPVDPTLSGPLLPPVAADDPKNSGANGGQKGATIDALIESPETLKSLLHDLEQLKAELEKEKETSFWFGFSLEIILAALALLASVVSILLSWFLFQSLDKDFKRIKASLHNFERQIKLKFGGLETEQERLTAQLKADVQSMQKKQDLLEASFSLKIQPSPFQSPPPSSPLTTAMVSAVPENPPPSLTAASLIRAVNSGDRQVLREALTAELNITSSSENSIVMGISEATELEEVSAGGSYLLVSLEGRNLLFPTDRTLRGFSTTQPSKGLYSFVQHGVAKAEIIEPAVLEKSGAVWRVIQKGRVAIP